MRDPPVPWKRPGALSLPGRLHAQRLVAAAMLAISAPAFWLAWSGLNLRLSGQAEFRSSLLHEPAVMGSALAGTLGLLLASWLAYRRRRRTHLVALVAVALCLLPLLIHADAAPGLSLVAWVWAAVVVYVVMVRRVVPARAGPKASDDPSTVYAPAVLHSGLAALIPAAYASGVRDLESLPGRWSILALLLVAAGVATAAEFALVRDKRLDPRLAAGLALLTALALVPWPVPGLGAALLGLRVLASSLGAARAHELRGEVVGYLWSRPALLILLTFAALSLAGGLVLNLPLSTPGHQRLDLLDSLFTAVSACCVTGLVVVDTAQDFTLAGQLIILLLIQVGAIGIMTLSAVATLILGGTLGSRTEGALSETLGADSPRATLRLLRAIVLATLAIELVGTLLLLPAFLAAEPTVAGGIWKALFHAVSAFCNAGFSLQSDSLVAFQRNPLVLHVVSLLILLGGAGFGVLVGLAEALRRRRWRPSLHLKLVLATNGVLLAAAFSTWMVVEWNHSLTGLGVADRFNNAWLQAVTLRTAGFNSVDLAALTPPVILMALVFMFIGASPGSTGGGIKTTTVATLSLVVVAVVQRRTDVQVAGRRIPPATVYRAAAVATISGALVFLATVLLMLTQELPFEQVLFEAVSAFGTVGLSLGITPELDSFGKLVIMILMFVGRTGPLTMALLFRGQQAAAIRYPEEEVMVG